MESGCLEGHVAAASDLATDDQISAYAIDSRDVITVAMDRIAARADTGGHAITGLPTGLFDLDDATGGFQAGQLVVMAARPSMGKTALALNMCDFAAVEWSTAVMYVSLQMGHLEIVERLLCARSRIDNYKLRTGMGLGNREMTVLARAFGELERGAPIFIDDSPRGDMGRIIESARGLKLREQIGLLVIDCITLIGSCPDSEDDQGLLSAITRELKGLARELEIPVLALSQLGRAVERREDRRPRMSDLKGSGAIEDAADIVLLLHRPDYYDQNDQPGVAEVIVAKNRNGRTDTVKLMFERKFSRFDNMANIAAPLDEGAEPY